MGYLILVRHGESQWNLKNKFTGWVDVPLSKNGINEALRTARAIKKLDLDVAFTSKLQRAQETLLLILAYQKKCGIFLHNDPNDIKEKKWFLHPHEFEKDEIPIYSSEEINERYYGDLQGKNKDEIRKEFGEEQVFIWRRSFDVNPPKAESLKDVYERTIPYFKNNIMRHVRSGKNVIVSAHGNSLRSIIKFLDEIPDEKIPYLELETGKPIIYRYSHGVLKKVNEKFDYVRPIKWE